MNRKPTQQIYLHSDLSLSGKNSHRPLLEQTLPKYRKQILQKNLDTYNKDLTSRVKQKYRNFGEDDFIKKLKYNSTKQIDRKSIKAIDKYLHELNKEKHQPMGYLQKTNSMKGFSNINSENISNHENQESIQSSKIKLNKKLSLSIMPAGLKNNSEQTVNIKKDNQSLRGKNRELLQDLNLSESDQETIKESAKFQENQSEKWAGRHNSPTRQRNMVNIISFRKNTEGYQSGVNSPSELRHFQKDFMGKSKQLMTKLQQVEENERTSQLMSENNFYHKFLSPSNKTLNIYRKPAKERPTVDTELKNWQFSEGERWISKNGSMLVEQELRMLREKNEEQQEIIKLQEIMIEKLNVQLENVLRKNHEREGKNFREESIEIYQDDQKVDELKNLLIEKQAKSKDQGLKCMKLDEQLKNYVESTSEQWNQGFQRLKNILLDMEFQQNGRDQYLCDQFEVNRSGEHESQLDHFAPRVNHSREQEETDEGQNLESVNYFYYVPPKLSSSNGGVQASKQAHSAEFSNLYTLSIEPEKKWMEYSGGSDFEFDLIEEREIKEE